MEQYGQHLYSTKEKVLDFESFNISRKEAFHALTESLKLTRNNWKIWSNYLYVCTVILSCFYIESAQDIGEFGQAMHALKEILDLDPNQIDSEVCLGRIHNIEGV